MVVSRLRFFVKRMEITLATPNCMPGCLARQCAGKHKRKKVLNLWWHLLTLVFLVFHSQVFIEFKFMQLYGVLFATVIPVV